MKKSNLDISKKSDLLRVVEKNNIDTIVNCAAFTDVLGAKKKKKCDKINIESLKYCRICFDFDVKLIHFSTDYVFDGYKKNHI